MKIIFFILIVLLSGCLSASSITGADAQALAKGSQASLQGSNSQNNSLSSITEYLDSAGKVLSRTIIAQTGQVSNQQSDLLQEIKASSKSSADAAASSKINLIYALVALGILLVFSVGSRTLWPLIKKLS